VLLGLFGGNVCCWFFEVAMCGVLSFKWQCVWLGLLGWQSLFSDLLGSNVCWVCYVAICVVLGLLVCNVCCWVF